MISNHKKLAAFKQKLAKYQAEGYQEHLLTVDMKDVAKETGVIVLVPSFIFIFLAIVFFIEQFNSPSITELVLQIVLFMVLHIVLLFVHEGIHALSFGFFSKTAKGISFGRIGLIALYCYNSNPLNKRQYLISVLMPLIVLGIIPACIAIYYRNAFWLTQASLMIVSAIGDVAVAIKIIKEKTDNQSVYLDHPTEIGVVCLTKD